MFFWNLDSDSIFAPFRRYFGTPKTWIFAFFSYLLLANFEAFFWRRTKTGKNSTFQHFRRSQARIDGVREPLGRDLEMGIRTSELRLMRLAKLVTSYMIRLAFSTPCSPVGRRRISTLRAFRRAGDEVARDNLAGNRWADMVRQKASLDMKSIVLVPKR